MMDMVEVITLKFLGVEVCSYQRVRLHGSGTRNHKMVEVQVATVQKGPDQCPSSGVSVTTRVEKGSMSRGELDPGEVTAMGKVKVEGLVDGVAVEAPCS